jgi:hypothetical protein
MKNFPYSSISKIETKCIGKQINMSFSLESSMNNRAFFTRNRLIFSEKRIEKQKILKLRK